MKLFCLIRHSKSSWDNPSLKDIDRPLTEKGIQNSLFMVEKLKEKKIKFDALISSPAERALHTAQLFANALGYPTDNIIIKKGIYESTMSEFLSIIRNTRESYNNVIFFGHNPSITELTNYLTNNRIDNIPTTGIAIIKSTAERWIEVSNINCILDDFIFPKLYKMIE